MGAEVKGVNKTKIDAGGSGSNYLDSGNYGAEVKMIAETYTAAALETASTIALPNLPVGAKIVGATLSSEDMGSGVTLKLGDSADDDRYLSAVNVASEAVSTAIRPTGLFYVIGTNDGDTKPLLTTSGTQTGVVKVAIFYVL